MRPLTVGKTALFIRHAGDVWTDEERLAFVDFIARNPEAGDVIDPGDGRRSQGTVGPAGQRQAGRVRVIYIYYRADLSLYLLLIYAKAQHEDLSPEAKRAAEALAARLKRAPGR